MSQTNPKYVFESDKDWPVLVVLVESLEKDLNLTYRDYMLYSTGNRSVLLTSNDKLGMALQSEGSLLRPLPLNEFQMVTHTNEKPVKYIGNKNLYGTYN